MPFVSKSQMGVCYKKQIQDAARGKKSSWDCDEWLSKTPQPCALPYRKGHPQNADSGECRNFRKGDAKSLASHGPLYRGSRGGYYFLLKGVKIYVPKGSKTLKWAKDKYGVRT